MQPISADLNALPVFAAVAEAGGFTAAADRLGLAKAQVSQAVARLERQLGVTLFSRTTRKVALTDAGQALYEQCVPALRGIEDGLAGLGGTGELSGTLRVAAGVDYGAQAVAPALAAFAALHPQLAIELRSSDRVVDLLAEGIDVAVRRGWLRDSSLRATRLGDLHQVLVASPAYLARAPRLAQPGDLARNEWIALTLLPSPLTWKFTSARGQTRSVRVNARLRTDSVASQRALLLAGAGISVTDQLSSAGALDSGALVRLLPRWQLPRGGVYAVLPPGRHVPAKARAFVEFFRDWLAQPAVQPTS